MWSRLFSLKRHFWKEQVEIVMDSIEKLKSLNNGFGPICKPRNKNRKTLAAVSVVLVYFLATLFYQVLKVGRPLKEVIDFNIGLCCGILSSAIFGEIIRRFCLYAEEIYHADTRYMGSKGKALSACLSIPKNTQVRSFVCLSVLF